LPTKKVTAHDACQQKKTRRVSGTRDRRRTGEEKRIKMTKKRSHTGPGKAKTATTKDKRVVERCNRNVT